MRWPWLVVLGALAMVFATTLALSPSGVLAKASEESAIVPSPTSLTFADGSSGAQSVTVTNRGQNRARLTNLRISAGFAIQNGDCNGATLVLKATCTVSVLASQRGPAQGTLAVDDTNPSAVTPTLLVALSILGPTPPPAPAGSIFLNPGSAPPASRVTFSGTGLDPNAVLAVLFDGNHVADVNTDGSGNFTIQLAVPDNATGTGTNHQVCVGESNGNVCSGFTLEAAPAGTPSPTDTVSPSPSPSDGAPTAANASNRGSASVLSLLVRPPFVFLPIIAGIALLAFLGLYLWRGRPAPAIGEVTILHRAPEARVYESQPEPAPAAPSTATPPPTVYESPAGTPPLQPPPRPPAPPSGADVPPDLPEASD